MIPNYFGGEIPAYLKKAKRLYSIPFVVHLDHTDRWTGTS